MTKKALKKLSEEQIEYLKTASVLLDQARKNNLKEEFERNAGKLRGFLECMCQMKIISDIEVKALYLWFFEKNRAYDV